MYNAANGRDQTQVSIAQETETEKRDVQSSEEDILGGGHHCLLARPPIGAGKCKVQHFQLRIK